MKTSHEGPDAPVRTDAPTAAMRAALAEARRGQLAGEPPVGACIVQDGQVIASAHTAVVGGPDPTAHAEILAIRAACQHRRTPALDGCELVVTVEPCAMCLAAAHYAGIRQVWFGAPLEAMQEVTGAELRGPVPVGMIVTGGLLTPECAGLLGEWRDLRALAATRRRGR